MHKSNKVCNMPTNEVNRKCAGAVGKKKKERENLVGATQGRE